MVSAWVAIGLYLSHQRIFPILLVFFSESHHSLPGQCSFTDTFETQDSNMYVCSFAKSENYSSSEVSLSSVQLFLSSEALFINSEFDIFVMKLVLSSKSFLSFFLIYLIFLWVLLNRAPTSIQLHLHPPPLQLHPPPPGLFCNNLNIARTKIFHVIGQFPKI